MSRVVIMPPMARCGQCRCSVQCRVRGGCYGFLQDSNWLMIWYELSVWPRALFDMRRSKPSGIAPTAHQNLSTVTESTGILHAFAESLARNSKNSQHPS